MKISQIKKIFLLFSLIVSIFACAGCSYIFPVEEDNLKPPVVPATKIDYSTIKVTKGNIENTYEGTLNVESNSYSNLSFKTRSGYISYINNSIGASVKKGDVIAKLDTAQIEADIESAESSLKKSQLSYDEMVKKAKSTASVDLKIAKLNLDKQEDEYNSLLASSQSGSYEVELARLNLEKAKNQYQVLQETSGTNSAEVKIAAENIKELKNHIKELKTELSQCVLTSPINGTITQNAQLAVGDSIGANSLVAKIEEKNSYDLTLSDSYPNIISYDNVIVTYKDKEYKGKFIPASKKESSDENSTPKYIFKSTTAIPDLNFSSTAKFKIILESKKDVLLLPRNVIQYLNDNQTTVSIYKDGVKEERGIILGIVTSTYVEVVEGLNEGDEVVIN